MELYKAPEEYPEDDKFTIFLGGSIEMDKAELWQDDLSERLKHIDIRILNPRRDFFDKDQEQTIKNPYFKEQVDWELDGLNRSDLIVMYLQPGTSSPVSMLEIGLYINSIEWNQYMVICCPDGFWRKGNIEIVVDRFPSRCRILDKYEDLEKFITNYYLNE